MSLQSLLMVMIAASTACGTVPAQASATEMGAAAGDWQADSSDDWFSASRLQGRLGLTTSSPRLGRLDAFPGSASETSRLESLSLMGDYYFSSPRGGLRATGGLILGSRSTLWAVQPSFGSGGTLAAFAAERRNLGLGSVAGGDAYGDNGPSAVPYLGMGYTARLSAYRPGVGQRAGSWGFTADLGLMALSPRSAVQFGRVFNGQQNFDEFLRELKLAPMVQLGVSYSF